jgi:hypothetical protein
MYITNEIFIYTLEICCSARTAPSKRCARDVTRERARESAGERKREKERKRESGRKREREK